ncbi:MAG: hypothetical protein WAJ88_04675, partial [Pseudolabrys sp.]
MVSDVPLGALLSGG